MNPKDIPIESGLKEDTSNPEWLKSVLSGFRVYVKKSDDQSDKWTTEHVRYDVRIDFAMPSGEVVDVWSGQYQCNRSCRPSQWDILQCVCSDAMSYDDARDMADFIYEFGFQDDRESIRKAVEAYEACKRTYEQLDRAGIDVPVVLNAAEAAHDWNTDEWLVPEDTVKLVTEDENG